MDITFLGSGNAFASDGRYWSSFLVDRRCLFDAPPTLLAHLKRLNVDLPEIETIFLTHQHADHFVGLPFLMLEYLYMTKRTKDLYIVGPPGVEAWMEDFATRCYPELHSKEAGYRRIYVEAQARQPLTAGNVTFESIPMNHVTHSMQAFGYRATINGRKVGYTGDTMYCDEIIELGQGTDVLVLDCTYADGSGPEHMGIEDAMRIRRHLPLETTIVLTHLSVTPVLNGMKNTLIAEDLKTFRF